jgi:2-polyprenyl-3-methyl-5-hydroxy-6-metoxy-1,4-benzoquinol methylase
MTGMRDHIRNCILGYHYGTAPVVARMAGRFLFRVGFLRRKAFFGLLDELIPPRTGAAALDIGCGSGKLLRALRLAGWAAEGVEWDHHAADVAAAYSECTIHTGDFSKLPLQGGKYDLVLLNHVFEHLDDPTQVFRRVGELLAPDGKAVLIYPNPAALGAKRFKEHWFSWEVPRHLVFVHPRKASALAHAVGLETASLRTLHRSAAGVSMLSRAYKRGRVLSTEEVVPGLGDHLFKWWERLRMLIEPMTGEEVLLVLRRAKSRGR